jgi:hypothetical protein
MRVWRRTRIVSALGVAVAIAAAGCGAVGRPHPGGLTGPGPAGGAGLPAVGPLPSGWGALRLATGAALPYPSDWHRISGDPGSASAAEFDRTGKIRAYLNVTPAEGHESLSNWITFRLRHNADEGDRNVRLISATAPRGLSRRISACVTDQYTTSRTSYRELACIVAPRGGARAIVLVAAAQPDLWPRERPAFEFAFSHFTS